MDPITKDEFYEWDMAATPGGRYVVYVSDRDGTPHIWRLDRQGPDPDKRKSERLTQSPNPEEDAALAPDGQWVVFSSISSDVRSAPMGAYRVSGRPRSREAILKSWPAYQADGRRCRQMESGSRLSTARTWRTGISRCCRRPGKERRAC